MTRTPLLIALLIAAVGGAQAQVPRVLKPLERSYELGLGDIVFPTSAVGSVIVKPCAECTNAMHRVDASTVYLLNGLAVPREDFMTAVESRRRTGRDDTLVGVHYDIETERVNRIQLSYAAR